MSKQEESKNKFIEVFRKCEREAPNGNPWHWETANAHGLFTAYHNAIAEGNAPHALISEAYATATHL